MAIGDIYYTLRKMTGTNSFEIRKWEEGRSYPLDIYQMVLEKSHMGVDVYRFQYCGCPSRASPCKHWDIADTLLRNIPWQELHHFYYQDGNIHEAKDV
jgi:hypothetical protein